MLRRVSYELLIASIGVGPSSCRRFVATDSIFPYSSYVFVRVCVLCMCSRTNLCIPLFLNRVLDVFVVSVGKTLMHVNQAYYRESNEWPCM